VYAGTISNIGKYFDHFELKIAFVRNRR